MSIDKPVLNVGMVGYAFMGTTHSNAWRTVGRAFDLPLAPRMRVLGGRDRGRVEAAAARLGWESVETDWRRVVEHPEVQLVDVVTPGDSHAEIAIAALEAGKHVLCEKPLANTVEEAEAMVTAAASAAERGIKAMVGFSYRRVPAVAMARRLVQEGRLGRIHHVRAQYLQDWIVDPEFPLVWRLQKDKAGSGALGDLGAHIIDMAQHVAGQLVTGVSGLTETFVEERPLPGASAGLAASRGSGAVEMGQVTVDDAAVFTARLSGGAVGTFEATRFATGRKNALRLEVNGSLGSVSLDLESMNELLFHDASEDPATAGFRRILVTEPEHPWMNAWWPPGHIIGYEHTFIHQARDLVCDIAGDLEPAPSFADGLQVQRVLAAVEQSAAGNGAWVPLGGGGAQ